MSKISIYEVVPVPKLADKLVGTSVGGDPEDITYNFTLSELLNLFIPNIPGNTLQGVLDFGNTATQDINLTGIITTTTLNVGSTANILNSNLTGQTHITGGLYDRLNSIGTAGQVLTSTGTQVEWYTIPTVIPDLQQVLAAGNTAVNNIILTGNLSANNAALLTSTISTSLTVLGTLKDGLSSVGTNNQVLSSNVTGVRWVNLPVYSATSPLLYNSGTGVFSIQQANASQNGYLSSADWITFDGKQTSISLTTTGNSGASTLVGATINVPNYTLSGLGGVPQTRTLTINGVTYNLTADRSWTLATGVSSVTATTPLFSTGGVNPDISIQQSSSSLDGYLSSTDWLTFNSKEPAITAGTTLQYYRGDKTFQTLNTTVVPEGTNLYYLDSRARTAISLTTTGSSGAATYNNTTGVFNIPDYGSALSGYVPTSRQLTINGTAYDLSADRTWSVGTVTSVAALTLGTTGTDLSSSVATGTTTPVITLNVPTASAANRGALSAADWSTFNTKVGGVTATSPLFSSGGSTPNITIQQSSGSQDGYLSSTDWTTFNNKQAAGNYITSLTGEATATGPGAAAVTLDNAAVTGKILTGVNITGGTVLATDTMLTAFGKLQNQVNGLIGGSIYQGTWNAATNTPTLTSSVGTQGYYYIVSVAGTTNLDGITDWFVGDWAIFNGGVWQQVDNTDAVVSVNGQTGAVSLTTDNIPEGVTNLYYTDTRARAALSFVAGSGAYNSSTGAITIPTNTSQLTNGANFITLGSLSGTAPISYNSGTGAISITQSGTASNGYLSSTDWNTFNNKQATLSLTTTGTSGAATLVGATLNVPNYGGALTGYVPYTGATANVDLGGFNITAGDTSSFVAATLTSNLWLKNTGTYHFIISNNTSLTTNTVRAYYTTTDELRFYAKNTAGASVVPKIMVGDGVTFTQLQSTITLTTTGTSGAATLVGATLNIPQYQTAGTYVTSVTASAPLSSSGSTNPNITITQVSSTVDGYLSFSDYNVFSGKISGSGFAGYITRYTGSGSTIGNSGLYDDGTTVSLISRALSGSSASFGSSVTATSFVKTSGTSSQYLMADGSVSTLTNPVTGTGTTNYLPKFTGASTIGNSLIYDNGTNVGIGTITAPRKFTVNGSALFGSTTNPQPAGSTHIVDIVATGGNSPLCLIAGSGNLELWNSLNVTRAVAIGMATPGTAMTDDFYISLYNGATWDTRLFINNSTGAATFSGNITVNGIYYVPNSSYFISGTAGFRFNNSTNAYNNFIVYDNGGTYTRGAATFSSTIDATRFISNVTNNYGFVLNRTAVTTYNGMSLQTAGTAKWFLGMRENLSSNNYIIYSEQIATDVLKLDVSTGAATFSSTITASSFSGAGTGLTGTASGLSIGGNTATATGQQSATNFTLNTGGAGYGLVGVYNPSVHQGLFAMGAAYTLTAGGGIGNLYGLSWTYDSAGYPTNTGYNIAHCMAVANNGTVYTLIGVGIWTSGLIRANGAISSGSTITATGNITGAYILGTYFNASAGNSENPTIGQIWTQSTGDDYLRKSTPAHFRSQVTDAYYPSLTGTGASGTWGISITGSAGSANTSSYTSNISCNFLGTGSVNVSNGSSAVYRNENGAGGNLNYAPVLHLAASDTMWQIQGDYYSSTTLQWRAGYSGTWYAWRQILHSANYNSYAPTLTGTGASGTWGISITGSAGSAPNGSNINNYYNSTAGNGYGFRFWNGSDAYKISMGASALYYYGPVTDYSIKMQMDNSSAGRGFTWGRESYAPIAALNSTSGNMQIAGTFTASNLNSGNGDVQWGGSERQVGRYRYLWYGYWAQWYDIQGGNGGGSLVYADTLYATYGSVSDIRYKKEVTASTYGLSDVLKMNTIRYKYDLPLEKRSGDDPNFHIGFSAQEMLEIVPEAVMYDKTREVYAIANGELIPVLVKAIQELKLEIETLKNK